MSEDLSLEEPEEILMFEEYVDWEGYDARRR